MAHLQMTADGAAARSFALLERDESLAALSRVLELARDRGRLVAISGEAGIGKSSLLQVFARREQAKAEFLWGGCDALRTPSPLGPLIDIAADLGGETAERLQSSVPRHELFAAFVDDLTRRRQPVVLIFEDVHWADEATLDLLAYAGRRIDRTHALLIVTWRDDEVDLDHAIHRVLADWQHQPMLRLELPPLSIDAVGRLAAGMRDPVALHALTGGNPFFVTEVLGTRPESVPATVRDAVLARRATLSEDARAVVDFVSIVPSRTEFTLLDAALHPSPAAVERCIAMGLLRSEPHAVTFRHELARMAVASALPPPRTRHYHRLVLDALLARADRSSVLARIVHHAEGCDDIDAIVTFAPAAARQASRVGAHRQAVEHYCRALAHRARLAEDRRAQLLEEYAYELYVTGNMHVAREARREALAHSRRLGVPLAVGRNTRWLSRLAWFVGDRAEAEACANEAIAVLSPLVSSEELAMAYSNRSQLDMLSGDVTNAIRWGTQAIELARQIGSTGVLSHALNNVGAARADAGDVAGLAQIHESLELGLANDLHEHAARAFTNLATSAITLHNYPSARGWLQRGMAYTASRDLDAWSIYMQAWRARLHAATGAWSAACDDAHAVLAAARLPGMSRLAALTALGLVHVRRGDTDAAAILDQAFALARPTRESPRLVPLLLARAELAWLTGRRRLEEVAAWMREGLAGIPSDGLPLLREHLTYWLWKMGASGIDIPVTDGPYACSMRGEWSRAAAYWSSKGCPYEQAQALMEGDVAAVTEALEIFQTLGATPAVGWARQRLRQLGARRLPRGRRATTRAHPAGLTARECDVLAMLARDLANPEIAAHLFVSRKTVEHHVSSILGKLGVPSREAAVARAREEGWVTAT